MKISAGQGSQVRDQQLSEKHLNTVNKSQSAVNLSLTYVRLAQKVNMKLNGRVSINTRFRFLTSTFLSTISQLCCGFDLGKSLRKR